jgi:heme/copper-type cytochrome/quinol oxidase subunit 3
VNHTAVASPHEETSTGLPTWKVGFWTFIGSETLFFGGLISTYLVYQGRSVVGPYPSDVFSIPLTTVSTFVLLMSSLAMVLALAAVQRDDRKGALTWLMTTAVMGMIFLGFQAYEFTHFVSMGLKIDTNLFGSSFYFMTGFHGAHVTVGVLWLLTLWVQVLRGQLGKANALRVEIAGLYWHFVDIIWIIIFTFVYLLE